MNVRLCPSCRGLVLAEFSFCPYCGVAMAGPSLGEALEGPFRRMGAGEEGRAEDAGTDVFASAKMDVFASVEERLGRLEADLELLLEQMEREGRSAK